MRLATFNLENFFSRPAAMNLPTVAAGTPILDAYARVNTLIQKDPYSATDKKDILKALETLKLKKSDESEFACLRQNHGRLIKRPAAPKPAEIVATGRSAWIGWVDLKTVPVDEIATKMTAKVIETINPDVLAVVEAEDRPTLLNFNQQFLKSHPFGGAMLIDGNDDRGIDIGVYLKPQFQLVSMVSHVDDRSQSGGRLFSRDCAEYTIADQAGNTFLLMVNHLKSKLGSPASSDARRKEQASRVRAIYDQRRNEGVKPIAIVGDFNDAPDSDPLSPLLVNNNSDLKDIFDHPSFVGDSRPGTFGNGTAKQKFDYILLSPDLFAKVSAGGIERRGVWGGTNGTLFPHFPEMTKKVNAASDHAAVFADFTL
jgi:endonuclease/exonuclease/phosphatase family metal-dependent hydrolase